MTEHMIHTGDTTVFVDVRGNPENPPLLYIHGGPGMSCWDFMRVQGDRLAQHVRLIGVDQRGILRSDRLPAGAPLSVADLVSDFEAVRKELGIPEWTILGHSAGGAYAIDYAVTHPDAVSGLILDCPAIDIERTDRYRAPYVASVLDTHGEPELARECRAIADLPGRLDPDSGIRRFAQALGDHWDDVNFHNRATQDEFNRTRGASGFTDADWASGSSHLPILAELYRDSRLPTLGKIATRSALLHGIHDMVAVPDLTRAYRETVGGPVTTFADSAHFPQLEEPDAYTAAVLDFMTG